MNLRRTFLLSLLICPPLKVQKGSGSPLRVLALVEDKA
jgi:kynurenine formamidase